MRSASDDGEPFLPWRLIRRDEHGNRYCVACYATRREARETAERLAAYSAARDGRGPAPSVAGTAPSGTAPDADGHRDGYLIESNEPAATGDPDQPAEPSGQAGSEEDAHDGYGPAGPRPRIPRPYGPSSRSSSHGRPAQPLTEDSDETA